ncbi:R-spondin-1 isoform X2 [Manis javanica]|uniref:R-spondin-1 isoform X2 n=1 Tax=Manis javanica TaxID=9974 RepID=UPI00187AAF6C|nr:R-spondin-1 isoform X2 [Manis javanica]
MRLGLCVVALVLSWMHLTEGSRGIKGKRQRRSGNSNLLTSRLCGSLGKIKVLLWPPSHPCCTLAVSVEGSQACSKGCELCSEVNGCLKCSPKLFILLERNDIRQVGVCLPSCPPGYFDARNPDMNKCIKCKIEHCEACFSHNFCTKCKESLYLHKGRCHPACPEGSTAASGTRECSSPVQCEMSEWSLWGPCSKKKKLCGFRRGSEERTRRVLHAPGGDHAICSDVKETRRCTVRRTPCPEACSDLTCLVGRGEGSRGWITHATGWITGCHRVLTSSHQALPLQCLTSAHCP